MAWISKKGLGIYTLIADTPWRNLAHYTLYRALQHAKKLGATAVNLGGAELDRLFHFKSRLAYAVDRDSTSIRRIYDIRMGK